MLYNYCNLLITMVKLNLDLIKFVVKSVAILLLIETLVYTNAIFSMFETHKLKHEHYTEKTYYKYDKIPNNTVFLKTISVKNSTYPVRVKPHLSKLINWTNPSYPITNVTYILENRDICKSLKSLDVLVIVYSAPHHFERRQAMRESWANATFYIDLGTVKFLFLLGTVIHDRIQVTIEKEFQQYTDVLQGDFVDTYFNLTHKGVMGYKWLSERCRNAEMILKVDDDYLVNMFIYFQNLRYIKSTRPVNVYCNYRTGRIQRNTKNKWYLSKDHFRGKTHYETYCRGMFVSMTNDIIPSLYVSASHSPFFPFEDVLLYGYVMHNIQGLKYKSLEPNDMEEYNGAANLCLKKLKKNCRLLVISARGRNEMLSTWLLILKYFSS